MGTNDDWQTISSFDERFEAPNIGTWRVTDDEPGG
jgi:hypothetical protein